MKTPPKGYHIEQGMREICDEACSTIGPDMQDYDRMVVIDIKEFPEWDGIVSEEIIKMRGKIWRVAGLFPLANFASAVPGKVSPGHRYTVGLKEHMTNEKIFEHYQRDK